MTTNESFISLSKKLKTMHIKNHNFFLETINDDVEYINPFSDELDEGQINNIIVECQNNIWFFLREIVQYRTDNGIEQFKLDLSNLANIYCALNNINHYVVTPVGFDKYYGGCAVLLWEILFKTDYNKIILNNIFNHGLFIYRMLFNMISCLPYYLAERLATSLDTDPKTILSVNNDELIVRLFAPQYAVAKRNIDKIKNENDGNISIYSDFEYMPVNVDLLDTNIPINKSYNMIITDVGSDRDINYGKINRFIADSVKWDTMYYDVDIEYIKEYIIKPSITHYMYIEHSYLDLEYDDAWIDETRYGLDDHTTERLIFLKR